MADAPGVQGGGGRSGGVCNDPLLAFLSGVGGNSPADMGTNHICGKRFANLFLWQNRSRASW